MPPILTCPAARTCSPGPFWRAAALDFGLS
jgi:hypothetical protein